MTLAPLLGLVLAAGQAADPLIGTWRGASLCLVRPSPCNDESVVYHVTGGAKGRYRVVMNKVVAGGEAEMGVVDAQFLPPILRGVTLDRQKRPNVWTFTLDGEQMHGELVTPNGRRYRAIEVKRTAGR
jgi:hypothetical protein